jgi:uncharacterized protein DUF5695
MRTHARQRKTNITVKAIRLTATSSSLGVITALRDSFRSRIFVAPAGLWLTLDVGTFESVELDSRTGVVRAGFAAATPATPEARLRIEQPAKLDGVGAYRPKAPLIKAPLKSERDAYVIPLSGQSTWIELAPIR